MDEFEWLRDERIFFCASRGYFPDEEDQALLAVFWEFDRKLIQEKHVAVVEGLDSSQGIGRG
jgi:hypothetical protein